VTAQPTAARKAAARKAAQEAAHVVGGAVRYPAFHYRALLASGESIDLIGIEDGSKLRDLILKQAPPDSRIVGVSDGKRVGWYVHEPEEEP